MLQPASEINEITLAHLERVELVIFDFDGVVADSEVISLRALQEALAAYRVEMDLDEVRSRFLGVSLTTILETVVALHPAVNMDGFAPFWENMLFARLKTDLTPIPGVVALLDHLAEAQMPYCIASSGTFDRIYIGLDTMDMRPRFEAPHRAKVFSAEMVANGKPAPDLFLRASADMGVEPTKCLVLEDSPKGVVGAKAAGMTAIGFVGGGHLTSIQEQHTAMLREAGADAVLTAY